MTRKPVLIRSYSRESEEAEQVLSSNGVEYTRFFNSEEGRPCVVSSYGTYVGVEGAQRFVRVVEKKVP